MGFSRDDVESTVFASYLDKGVFTISPFETIDADGVGAARADRCRGGRKTKAALKLGVCGEHGGDQSPSTSSTRRTWTTSPAPFRLPVARLEAGRAASADEMNTTSSRQRGRPIRAFAPLVVDDEAALAEVVASYLQRGALRGHGQPHRRPRAGRRARDGPRCGGAGSGIAGYRRAGGLPAAADVLRRLRGDADRPGHRDRHRHRSVGQGRTTI